MNDLDASGRPRILLLAILVALIGSFGALVLAPLLNAPKEGPKLLDVRLTIDRAPGESGGDSPLRVVVSRPGHPRVTLTVGAARETTGADLALLLASRAEDEGLAGVEADGVVLDIPGIDRLGVDAGTTGALLSLSASTPGLEATSYRLGLERDGEATTPTDARVRLGLVASAGTGKAEKEGVSASVEVPLVDGPGPAIQRIAQALMDAGWGVDHPPGKPNHLWIRTLPDAREPHALLLTIGYASSSPAAPGFSWTLAVTDED